MFIKRVSKKVKITKYRKNGRRKIKKVFKKVWWNIRRKDQENKKIKKKFLRQDEQRLLNRLKKYKDNHLLFLYDFTAPFDNNLSEKELRHIKMEQKISGYFSSFDGAKIYSNIKSLIITFKKQGKNFYNEIINIYENNPVNIQLTGLFSCFSLNSNRFLIWIGKNNWLLIKIMLI